VQVPERTPADSPTILMAGWAIELIVMSPEVNDIKHLQRGLQYLPSPFLLRKYEAAEEDFEQLADEDLRCEYMDGVLLVHSPASYEHERRVVFVSTLLEVYAASRRLGEVCGSNTVMQLGSHRFCADVGFLAAAHADRVRNRRVMGPLDLAVEIISPSTREYDLGEKRRAYREARIPEIWLIDAESRQFHIDRLDSDSYLSQTHVTGSFEADVLPGLTFIVDWLWAFPLPSPLQCLRSTGVQV
jgi:Uma2 family endonuclease